MAELPTFEDIGNAKPLPSLEPSDPQSLPSFDAIQSEEPIDKPPKPERGPTIGPFQRSGEPVSCLFGGSRKVHISR